MNPFKGKKIVITAGPTYEKIDPVRFIGNYSTGKMGFALAEKFLEMEANVTLISGPTHLSVSSNLIHLIRVESALQMLNACELEFENSDLLIMAAAVADYRPEVMHETKIKKKEDHLNVHLVKNPDILATLGLKKKPNQKVIGFALETNNELENALDKLKRKNADAIVLNSLNDAGAGFSHDTNKITIIMGKDLIFEFPLKNKDEVAKDIIQCLADNLY